MLNNIVTVISIILSILAFAMSVLNYALSRRRLVAEAIAENRMEWIKAVRELLNSFVESYLNKEDSLKLRIRKSKIDLYIKRGDPVYSGLDNILERCINTGYNEEDYSKLIYECQQVLNTVWRRMKLESGISKKEESKIRRIILRQ